MSIVKTDANLFPFALSYTFLEDRGYPMVLEMFDGVMPTKTEIEAADIYTDDGSGWIDKTKLEFFLGSYNLIRRWKLDDFSKNITPLSASILQFGFSERANDDYLLIQDSYNQFNPGVISWYLIRSINTSNSVSHYMFTGTVTDLGDGGDMEMKRRNVSDQEDVRPGNITIDLGALVTV